MKAVKSIVNRMSVKLFRDCVHVLPLLACDREHGCWGFPGCVWASIGWLRWSVQISMYDRPCEHCFGYTAKEEGE